MRMMGKILLWNERESNGFIKDVLGNHYYFKFSSIKNKPEDRKNKFVYFEILETTNGNIRARNIVFSPKKDIKTLTALFSIR